jgi:hypothetical protein
MHTNDFEDSPSVPLPCVGGLIAGTLALMTCWAAPEPSANASEEQQRLLMARKIASNLFFLREHPDLAPGMRQVIGKVHQRWVLLAHALPADNEAAIDQARPAYADAVSALH